MMAIDKKLMEEAAKHGLNPSTYCLLPPKVRETALRKDIERAKQRITLKGGVGDAN